MFEFLKFNTMKEVTVKELKAMIDNKEDFQLIDVREEHEFDICNLDGKLIPMVIKKGDQIVYPKYAGHPIKLDGIEYLILDENEVLGVIKGELKNG
jgi:co-chaperonin GroES (HSP10)